MLSIIDRNIDKVDETMDDIRDQMDIANEISEAISRPVGVGDDLDEVHTHTWISFKRRCSYVIILGRVA
jgi:hypothetical protein